MLLLEKSSSSLIQSCLICGNPHVTPESPRTRTLGFPWKPTTFRFTSSGSDPRQKISWAAESGSAFLSQLNLNRGGRARPQLRGQCQGQGQGPGARGQGKGKRGGCNETHFAFRTVADAHFAAWPWLRWGGGAYPSGLRMHRCDSALQSCQPSSAAPRPDPTAQIFFQLKEARRALASLLAVAVLRCYAPLTAQDHVGHFRSATVCDVRSQSHGFLTHGSTAAARSLHGSIAS